MFTNWPYFSGFLSSTKAIISSKLQDIVFGCFIYLDHIAIDISMVETNIMECC
jgi:hypothetical protein